MPSPESLAQLDQETLTFLLSFLIVLGGPFITVTILSKLAPRLDDKELWSANQPPSEEL